MKTGLVALLALSTTTLICPARGQTIAADTTRTTVTEFVQKTYAEGVPYREVVQLDASVAVPALLEMLADPRNEPYWPNIVVALGMIGDARAVQPLIAFIERDVPGRILSRDQYIAKASAVMALGYLINKSNSQQALAYLQKSVQPDAWRARDMRWISPYHPTERERDLQLSTMTILGLGLSGNPSAAATLHSLEQRGSTAADRNFRAKVRDAVSEALKANAAIAMGGLTQYYERVQP